MRIFVVAVVLLVIWGGAFAVGSFIDPENIGGRLALYAVGALAFIAGVILLIVGIVKRVRAESAGQQRR
jgi:hypothetical protein